MDASRVPVPADYYRVLAVDYDGTLTRHGPPSEEVLEALAVFRESHRKTVLVTGRILWELRSDFPGVDSHFDAIVAENGAVLALPGHEDRSLHSPVNEELGAALAARRIPFRRGSVLLAVDGVWERAVLEEERRLGLECQLVRNRDALMVLPAGVSKGWGLHAALGELGISFHNTIAIGDAENDLSLLESVELGIAVGNAVESLKARADLVLAEPDGAGISAFLRSPLASGAAILSKRHQIELGQDRDGMPVFIPSAQVNVLISGATATGKSWLAGLLAERLLEMSYSVCVLDPEGDHPGLGALRGMMTLGGPDGAPEVGEIRRFLRHRFGSVVADLSALSWKEKRDFYPAALEQIENQRQENGAPQWVILDEAQLPAGKEITALRGGALSGKGVCLITWKPEELAQEVLDEVDLVLLTGPSAAELAWLPDRFRRPENGALLSSLQRGEALLMTPGAPGSATVIRIHSREISHVRHWHKYVTARLPLERRFRFRAREQSTGAEAANLPEFHHEIRHAPATSLVHHAALGDFSRWVREVVRDDLLADEIATIEKRWPADERTAEALRSSILEAIRSRYLAEGGADR